MTTIRTRTEGTVLFFWVPGKGIASGRRRCLKRRSKGHLGDAPSASEIVFLRMETEKEMKMSEGYLQLSEHTTMNDLGRGKGNLLKSEDIF